MIERERERRKMKMKKKHPDACVGRGRRGGWLAAIAIFLVVYHLMTSGGVRRRKKQRHVVSGTGTQGVEHRLSKFKEIKSGIGTLITNSRCVTLEPGSDSDKLPEMRSCAREFGRLCQSAQGVLCVYQYNGVPLNGFSASRGGNDGQVVPEVIRNSYEREFGQRKNKTNYDRPRDTHAQAQACTQTPVVPVFSSSRKVDVIKAKNEEEKISIANE
ncbi:hypothetical protein RUM43_011516 [Polyplax serrata]|uniref:Uncharacterized protein n=1 Tax=Polyplax serrata TaxID=468196 RepID=A0AAN8S0C2_POLSC